MKALFIIVFGAFGWLAVLGFGIGSLVSKHKSRKKKIAGIILLIIGLIWIGWVVYIVDRLPGARDEARFEACKSNLKQIGLAIHQYSFDHEGQIPTSLELLRDKDYIQANFDRLTTCPAGYEYEDEPYTPLKPMPKAYYRYFYYAPEGTNDGVVICEDAELHVIRHGIFKFLQPTLQNVLTADGHVFTINEKDLPRKQGILLK